MKLEQLTCPHCGGNDFDSLGNNSWRCHFCGGLSKDTPPPLPKTHVVAPLQTDFRNTYKPLQAEEDNTRSSTLAIIAFVALIFVLLVIILSSRDNNVKSPSESYSPAIDLQPQVDEFTEAISRQPERSENGISAANAEIVSDNGIGASIIYFSNTNYRIRIEKPEGFTIEKKKVFVGKYFEVRNKNNEALYRSGELDSLASEKGEKSRLYSDSLTMNFSTSPQFGFNGKGIYTVFYRIWDRKSKKYMNGTIPVYIEF